MLNTRRRTLLANASWILCLGIALPFWPACTSGVSDTRMSVRPQSTPSSFFGLGFDPGLALTDAIDGDIAVAGARIPKAQSTRGRSVAFVAFVTRARADDGDGTGRPLVKTAGQVPADTNSASDIFLAVVENNEIVLQGEPQPAAFTQALLPTFRDMRCERCHGFFTENGFRVTGHPRREVRSESNCEDCHSSEVFGPLRQDPNLISFDWDAPPAELDFARKSDRQVYDAVVNFPGAAEHLKFDAKINWAIASGRVPTGRTAEGGTVPIDLNTWHAQIDAWDLAGQPFGTDASVPDILLVSQVAGGVPPRAGNAASFAPSIVFEPEPAFDPANPTANPAGYVHVVFASDATDLVSTSSHTNRDIYRTRVEVHVSATQRLGLAYDAAQTRLVSRSILGSQGGDGDSDDPVLSQDGRFVAFESNASDLVLGFNDANGSEPDVYLSDLVANTSELKSRSSVAANTGGDAGSFDPTIAFDGSAVAFASDATDLVLDDSNGVRDIYLSTGQGMALTVERVSLPTGMGEGRGGSADAPSLFKDPGTGEVLVAFQASQEGLVTTRRTPPGPSLYLRDVTNATTELLSQRVDGRRTILADGPSFTPKITPDGSLIVYSSTSTNLDETRPRDRNDLEDVFTFDLDAFRTNQTFKHERLSISAGGLDANLPSNLPCITTLVDDAGNFTGEHLSLFTTEASNIGRAANSDKILFFLPDRTATITVAQFTADATTGSLQNGMFTVNFTDLSTNATAWAWDLDGDGNVDSNAQNPQFTYTLEQTFDVTLAVQGPGGDDSLTRFDYISIEPPSWTALYNDLNLVGCATSGCHDGLQTGCNGGVFSMVTEEDGFRALVGVNSVHCDQTKLRVLPGDLDGSILDDMVQANPNCPSCPTTFRMGSLDAGEVARVEAWILGGAPR